MDLEDCHYEEVYSILVTNTAGLDFDALFKKSKLFDERTDLSRCLHRAGQQGNVFKKNNIYRLTSEKYKEMTGNDFPEIPQEKKTETSDPITNEIKKLMASNPDVQKSIKAAKATVVTKEAEKVIPPKIHRIDKRASEAPKKEEKVELPLGNLRRSSALGGAAMALYRFRDEAPLTTGDISEMTGAANNVLCIALAKLVKLGYATKDVTNVKRPLFKWSGNFRYPFNGYQNRDDSLVKYTVLAWSKRTGTNKPISIPPDSVAVTPDTITVPTEESISEPAFKVAQLPMSDFIIGNLELIDLQIKAAEAKLNMLKHARLLIASQQQLSLNLS